MTKRSDELGGRPRHCGAATTSVETHADKDGHVDRVPGSPAAASPPVPRLLPTKGKAEKGSGRKIEERWTQR